MMPSFFSKSSNSFAKSPLSFAISTEADGYKVSRECYNSYFYVVEDEEINALDKFLLHGKELVDWLDDGRRSVGLLLEGAVRAGITP